MPGEVVKERLAIEWFYEIQIRHECRTFYQDTIVCLLMQDLVVESDANGLCSPKHIRLTDSDESLQPTICLRVPYRKPVSIVLTV